MPDGKCAPGTEWRTCGTGGKACGTCDKAESCIKGACVSDQPEGAPPPPPPPPDGGDAQPLPARDAGSETQTPAECSLTAHTGCSTGLTCAYNCGTASKYCREIGTQPVGGRCNYSEDCVADLICVGFGSANYCAYPCLTTSDCPTGLTCGRHSWQCSDPTRWGYLCTR